MKGIFYMRGIKLKYFYKLIIFILLIPQYCFGDGFEDKSPIKLVYPQAPKSEKKSISNTKNNYIIYTFIKYYYN